MRKSWRYIIYVLVLVLYYIWLLLSPAVFSPSSNIFSDRKITVTAHRGAAAYAPENTLASIQKAMDLGVDRIEIDIHQTKDSVVVVIHDESVDRTTNGKGKIADLSYDEIRKLDTGSKFGEEFKGEKVPSLEEVLQLIDGKFDLVIEFKEGNDRYPNIEENVIKILNKRNAVDWCIVHSFNIGVLERMNKKLPSIRLHKLFILNLRFTPIYIGTSFEFFDPKDYPYIEEYSLNKNFGNTAIIKELKRLGKKVNIWTINDQKMLSAYKQLGVDGVITDYPDIIR